MTPEECARWVLTDGQDPECREKAMRAADHAFAEAMTIRDYKAQWLASLRAMAEAIDRQALEYVMQAYALQKPHALNRQAQAQPAAAADASA